MRVEEVQQTRNLLLVAVRTTSQKKVLPTAARDALDTLLVVMLVIDELPTVCSGRREKICRATYISHRGAFLEGGLVEG
jgi:hypothetical protein